MPILLFFLLLLIAFWIIYQDTKYGRISNQAIIALSFLLIPVFYLNPSHWISNITAGIIGIFLAGILLLFQNHRSFIGGGDLKLFCLSCFFLCLNTLPIFIILTGVLGIVWALFYRVFRGKNTFPFGPSIIISLILTLVFFSPLSL